MDTGGYATRSAEPDKAAYFRGAGLHLDGSDGKLVEYRHCML